MERRLDVKRRLCLERSPRSEDLDADGFARGLGRGVARDPWSAFAQKFLPFFFAQAGELRAGNSIRASGEELERRDECLHARRALREIALERFVDDAAEIAGHPGSHFVDADD